MGLQPLNAPGTISKANVSAANEAVAPTAVPRPQLRSRSNPTLLVGPSDPVAAPDHTALESLPAHAAGLAPAQNAGIGLNSAKAGSGPLPPTNLRDNLLLGRDTVANIHGIVIPNNNFRTVGDAATSLASYPINIWNFVKLDLHPDPELDAPPKAMTHVGPDYSAVHNVARQTRDEAVQTGNCLEQACVAASELAKQARYPVEIFELADHKHAFTVIGRDPNSNAHDPLTWGPNAVVVDPWYNESYPAGEVGQKMSNKGMVPEVNLLKVVRGDWDALGHPINR